MPIELPPISRRRFLRSIVAAGAVAASWSALSRSSTLRAAEADVDEHLLALLSDIHLSADRSRMARGINMWDHLAQATREIVALPKRPVATLINGDCALARGLPDDYASVLASVQPLREAEIPVHLALGNHDHRSNFLAAIGDDDDRQSGAGDRVVSRLRLAHADVYLLDSLDKVNEVPGRLGAEQLAWLAKSLDAEADRPAVIILHHPTDLREVKDRGGLIDSEAFLDVVKPRRQVKALLYGHRHVWEARQEDGLHLVHLPATAYLFRDIDVAGWVEARITRDSMTLKLHAITPNHPQAGEIVELKWR
jgi:3',5'-cyclic AMP phosphodiesterase CpdA